MRARSVVSCKKRSFTLLFAVIKRLSAILFFVDGDLTELIKRSASDRLGNLVPQVGAQTSPGFLHDMVLLGLCLETFFQFYFCPVTMQSDANVFSIASFFSKQFCFEGCLHFLRTVVYHSQTARKTLRKGYLVMSFLFARFSSSKNSFCWPLAIYLPASKITG